MEIKDKIKYFLDQKGLNFSEIGRKLEMSPQNVSRIFSKNGRIPLDFVVWLKSEFPEIDLNELIKPKSKLSFISDAERPVYERNSSKKEKIMAEIGNILDELL